jgi:hypothetical protein
MDKLKYSQLLELGSKQVNQQCHGHMFTWQCGESNTYFASAACAIGMMVIGKAGTTRQDVGPMGDELFQELRTIVPPGRRRDLAETIVHWNDQRRWPVDKIKEKLEKLGY